MTVKKTIRVLLVDDQPSIRKGLRYIINIQTDMEVVGEASTGEEAVEAALHYLPDVVLMDIRMPGGSGIAATKRIMESLPRTKVVLLTTFDVTTYVYDGIRAGAAGYLLKDKDAEEMLSDLRAINRGATLYNSTTANIALQQLLNPGVDADSDTSEQRDFLDRLTSRETEVLQLLAYGKRNHEIASMMYISEGTVKTHIHNIIQKLGAKDRTQAVVIGIRHKLVN